MPSGCATAPSAGDAHAEQHREAEHDERHGARRAAQREAGVGVEERLEAPADERRVVPRVGADGDDGADDDEPTKNAR